MKNKKIGRELFVALITEFCICAIVMLLWNWLIPVLFGFTTITYLQAIGISVLCNVMFKNNKKIESKHGKGF